MTRDAARSDLAEPPVEQLLHDASEPMSLGLIADLLGSPRDAVGRQLTYLQRQGRAAQASGRWRWRRR